VGRPYDHVDRTVNAGRSGEGQVRETKLLRRERRIALGDADNLRDRRFEADWNSSSRPSMSASFP
jgi:hypothetical protein